MVDRILKIIKERNLTAKDFANILEIPPAIITHITTGRNNPSLDLIIKIKSKFPDINLNWLMLGENKMYATEKLELEKEFIGDSVSGGNLFSKNKSILPEEKAVHVELQIEKVIVLYKNGLFKEYNSL